MKRLHYASCSSGLSIVDRHQRIGDARDPRLNAPGKALGKSIDVGAHNLNIVPKFAGFNGDSDDVSAPPLE